MRAVLLAAASFVVCARVCPSVQTARAQDSKPSSGEAAGSGPAANPYYSDGAADVDSAANPDSPDDAAGFGAAPSADDAAGFGPAPSADDAAGFGAGAGTDSSEAGSMCSEVMDSSETGSLVASGFARAEISYFPRLSETPLRFGRATLEAAMHYTRDALALHAGLHAETDFVARYWSRGYRDSERESEGTWLAPWELYGQLQHGAFSLSTGRQISTFGQAQAFPLLDLVNPRDLRAPLLGAPAERRIPLWLTRAALEDGSHRLELIAIHEADYRWRPPPLGLYSVVPTVLRRSVNAENLSRLNDALLGDAVYRHASSGLSLGAFQALLRYRYTGEGPELGLLAGYVTQQEGLLSFPGSEAWAEEPLVLPVAHPRYSVIGGSLLSPIGSFMIYAEALAELPRPVALAALGGEQPALTSQPQLWFRGTLGVRYEGIPDGFVLLEATAGGTSSSPIAGLSVLLPVAPLNVAATYRQNMFRDRVELELIAIGLGPQAWRGGFLARSQLSYRAFDALRAQLAYLLCWEGPDLSLITGCPRHRLDFNLRWDFALP